MGKMDDKKTIAQFLDDLVRKGQYHFTVCEIAEALSLKEDSVSVTLSRLGKKDKVKIIRNKFGIITGLSSGVIDPSYFINAMMKHLGSRYYVGLLSAASYWGASHQSPMVYYIVAEKVIKPIRLGGLRIEFITKSNFDEITETQKVAGVGGYYNVSTPELTAVDLLKFPKKSGHLNNIATILADLASKIDFKKLRLLCEKSSTPTAVVQRLGFIFDAILEIPKADILQAVLKERKQKRTPLSASKRKEKGDSKYPFNRKWNIYENTTVEPD
jgi:predicted transcriptional regulator of viral defense system